MISSTIDWEQEVKTAAADTLRAYDRTARQGSALNRQHAPTDSSPASTRQFGWSHARTHRVESIPGGGFLININDRCAIIVPLAFFPVCKIGKIEARGDLFLHMEDPPSRP